MITIKDAHTEIIMGPSKAQPGKINVTIFGRTEDGVLGTIKKFSDNYGNFMFLDPVACPDGWGTMGRVWNEVVDVSEILDRF